MSASIDYSDHKKYRQWLEAFMSTVMVPIVHEVLDTKFKYKLHKLNAILISDAQFTSDILDAHRNKYKTA